MFFAKLFGALSLVFTSCDELIGELDNLAPSPVAP